MFLAAPIPRQISGGATPAAWAPPGPLSAAPSQPGRAQLLQALGPWLYLHAQTSAWRAAGQTPPRTPRKLAGSTPPCSSLLMGFLPSRGAPRPSCSASPPASLKTPTFRREERTKKPQIEINKAFVGSPAISQAPPKPTGDPRSSSNFLLYYLPCKTLPQTESPKGLKYHGDSPKSMRTHLLTFLHSFWI